jgi:hypothetical protein
MSQRNLSPGAVHQHRALAFCGWSKAVRAKLRVGLRLAGWKSQFCLLAPHDELFAKIAEMGHGAAEGREPKPQEDEEHLASARQSFHR